MPTAPSRPVLVAVIAAALGGCLALWLRSAPPHGGTPSPASAPASNPSTTASAPAPIATPTSAPRGVPETAEPAAPAPPALLSGEPALEAISDLSATYDAASVPALARYLGHSDPEIRAAARDGLVNLGERAAIPFLEAAAKKAPAEEAKELRDAAEFLALPTWTERRAAERKAKAAQTAP